MRRAVRGVACAALCLALLWWTPARADPALNGFLAGTYAAIGKLPDSETTYAGTVTIEQDAGALRIVRAFGGNEVVGKGTLAKGLHGEADILIVRFSDDGKDYEASYLINADLDNYARLTGTVYLADGGTKRAGLEALFPDHGLER